MIKKILSFIFYIMFLLIIPIAFLVDYGISNRTARESWKKIISGDWDSE